MKPEQSNAEKPKMGRMKFWTIASTIVSTLWWIGGSGEHENKEQPTAPALPSTPVSAPDITPHRLNMSEINQLLHVGAQIGARLDHLNAQEICALGVSTQDGPALRADFNACAKRHGELDRGLLMAGKIVEQTGGAGTLDQATQVDICGLFGVAAVRADLADLQKGNHTLPAEQNVADSINAMLVACEKKQGKNWTIPSALWEELGNGVVFNTFYPAVKP